MLVLCPDCLVITVTQTTSVARAIVGRLFGLKTAVHCCWNDSVASVPFLADLQGKRPKGAQSSPALVLLSQVRGTMFPLTSLRSSAATHQSTDRVE